jgi:hypothetical protein
MAWRRMDNGSWVTISINGYMSDRPMIVMRYASDDMIGQLDPLAA